MKTKKSKLTKKLRPKKCCTLGTYLGGLWVNLPLYRTVYIMWTLSTYSVDLPVVLHEIGTLACSALGRYTYVRFKLKPIIVQPNTNYGQFTILNFISKT